MKILDRKFYNLDTVEVAKNLIGKILVRELNGDLLTGIIIETEAYRSDDPACHAFNGKTQRNKALFEQVGRAYIYFTYGNHYCLNAVARSDSFISGGVLIRAIKPIDGIEIMKQNRKIHEIKNLTNGPGKLTKALNIDKSIYGSDLTKKGQIYITEGIEIPHNQIQITERIGISKAKDEKWRFYIDPKLI